MEQTIQAIHDEGRRAALCIKPATPPEAVFPYLDALEMVLVMSVEPGFGGQKFMPAAVEKIAAIRAEAQRRGLSTDIEVDGGISSHNAHEVFGAGADVLVAGNAVFGAEDPQAEIVKMLNA